jgi:hypothetical protein
MPRKTNLLGVRAKRGERMTPGRGWRLVGPGKQVFKATLIRRLSIGQESVAVFRVVPVPED